MELRPFVTDPHDFFAKRAEDPSLRGPAAVVCIHALGSLVVAVAVLGSFTDLVVASSNESVVYAAGGQRVSAPRDLVVGFVLAGVVYFATWVLVAVVVYAVSMYFDGDGPFRRVLALVGWGLAPSLLPTLGRQAFLVSKFLGAPSFASEAAVEEWVRANVITDPVLLGIGYLRPLFTLWVVYLWVLAARYGRDLTRRQALVCVALPGAIALVNDLGVFADLIV